MELRAILVGLVMLASAAPALAEARTFERADYETYFAPGRFKTHAVYYASFGLYEITGNRSTSFGGRYFLEQRAQALDVSPNYDTLSDHAFYKIQSSGAETMVWDEGRKAYLYEYSNADFDANTSVVWESDNDDIQITPGDVNAGKLHAFYRGADKRASADVEALDAKYRKDVVGAWTMQCAYIVDDEWDVECLVNHVPTKRLERYYYRKLDLMS